MVNKKREKKAVKGAASLKRSKPKPKPKPTPKLRPTPQACSESAAAAPESAEGAEVEAIFAALPPRQQAFITEYFAQSFNAAAAARSAGYSVRTAESQGPRLLKDPRIAGVVAHRSRNLLAKRKLTAERVLGEIEKLAMYDPRKLFTSDGNLIPFSELGEEEGAAIAGLDVKELYESQTPVGQLKKIKLADKGANLERLMRYFGLFRDRLEVNHKITRVVVREELKEPRQLPPQQPDFGEIRGISGT